MKFRIKFNFKNKNKNKKKIKLICTDLDGTLLNEVSQADSYTKEVLKLAKNKDYEVVIATGRPKKFTLLFCKEVEVSRYIICQNGALIYDRETDTKIFQKGINKANVIKLINLFDENNINYHIYIEKDDQEIIISNKLGYNLKRFHESNFLKPIDKRTDILIVDNVLNYINKHNIEVFYKINIYTNDKKHLEKIVKKINKNKEYEILNINERNTEVPDYINNKVIEESYYYTEITAKGINKQYAIEVLKKHLKLKNCGVMAIGDYINDLKMIKTAEVGIAMKNGVDSVKKVADYITDTNTNSGAAKAILKVINEEI